MKILPEKKLTHALNRWVGSAKMIWLAPLGIWAWLVTLLICSAIWRISVSKFSLDAELRNDTGMILVVTLLSLAIGRLLYVNRQQLSHTQRLSRFNTLLAQTNQAITQCEDEDTLLQDFCQLAVVKAGVSLAWVGLPDDHGTIRFLAMAGKTAYLEGIYLSVLEDVSQGQEATGRAWRSGGPVYETFHSDNSTWEPWRRRALQHDLTSTAVLPLSRNGSQWAVLALYHGQHGVFDPELQEILEELARDLSHALDHIDLVHREKDATTLLQSLTSNTSAGMALISYPEGLMINANHRLATQLGKTSVEDLIGRSTREIFGDQKTYDDISKLSQLALVDGDAKAFDYPLHSSSTSTTYFDISVSPINRNSHGQEYFTWTFIDVTEKHLLAVKLAKQAHVDVLTELPNRRALDQRLDCALLNKNHLAVCMMDLDGFKAVNDVYGHELGDQVLKVIGNRLASNMRHSEDFIARLGGDEFVLVIENPASLVGIEGFLDRIEASISEPIVLNDDVAVALGAILFR